VGGWLSVALCAQYSEMASATTSRSILLPLAEAPGHTVWSGVIVAVAEAVAKVLDAVEERQAVAVRLSQVGIVL
jgi:hypothetical protein